MHMFSRRRQKKSNSLNTARSGTASYDEPRCIAPSNTIEELPMKDKEAKPPKTNSKNEIVLQERQNSNHDILNKQFETLTLYNLNNNAEVSNIPTFHHPRTLSSKEFPKIVSRRCSTVTNEYKPLELQIMPIEIKLWIFSFLESTDLAAVSCVCKDWNILSKERHLWIGKRRGVIARKLKVASLERFDENGNVISSFSYRIVLVGAGGVGKSALVVRFVIGKFVEKYDPTIEDGYRVQCHIDNEVTNLDIIDTAGPEEYSALRDQYIKLGNGFIIVYSASSPHSFQAVPKLYQSILRLKQCDEGSVNVPIILVGNKSDLDKERAVSIQEAQTLANKYSHFTRNFWETSAKSNRGVNDIFFEIVRQIDTMNEMERIKKLATTKKKKRGTCVLQ